MALAVAMRLEPENAEVRELDKAYQNSKHPRRVTSNKAPSTLSKYLLAEVESLRQTGDDESKKLASCLAMIAEGLIYPENGSY